MGRHYRRLSLSATYAPGNCNDSHPDFKDPHAPCFLSIYWNHWPTVLGLSDATPKTYPSGYLPLPWRHTAINWHLHSSCSCLEESACLAISVLCRVPSRSLIASIAPGHLSHDRGQARKDVSLNAHMAVLLDLGTFCDRCLFYFNSFGSGSQSLGESVAHSIRNLVRHGYTPTSAVAASISLSVLLWTMCCNLILFFPGVASCQIAQMPTEWTRRLLGAIARLRYTQPTSPLHRLRNCLLSLMIASILVVREILFSHAISLMRVWAMFAISIWIFLWPHRSTNLHSRSSTQTTTETMSKATTCGNLVKFCLFYSWCCH